MSLYFWCFFFMVVRCGLLRKYYRDDSSIHQSPRNNIVVILYTCLLFRSPPSLCKGVVVNVKWSLCAWFFSAVL